MACCTRPIEPELPLVWWRRETFEVYYFPEGWGGSMKKVQKTYTAVLSELRSRSEKLAESGKKDAKRCKAWGEGTPKEAKWVRK